MFTMVAIAAIKFRGGRCARNYAERVRRIGGGERARPRALSMHWSHGGRDAAAATGVDRAPSLHYDTHARTRLPR